MANKLKSLNERELLQKYDKIINELKEREIIRTGNNPISDYGEWLVSKKLKLSLLPNSKKGYDAVNNRKVKYQIKCRRPTEKNKSKQLSVIRNLKDKSFDLLIGIIFDNAYNVVEAYQIPHDVIKKHATFSKHQNGHILHLKGKILEDKKVKDILTKFA
jgi:hypothetical protein